MHHTYGQFPKKYSYTNTPPKNLKRLPTSQPRIVRLEKVERPRDITVLFYYTVKQTGEFFAHVMDTGQELDVEAEWLNGVIPHITFKPYQELVISDDHYCNVCNTFEDGRYFIVRTHTTANSSSSLQYCEACLTNLATLLAAHGFSPKED